MSAAEMSGRPAQGLHHAVNERVRSVQVRQVLAQPLALTYAEHTAAAILGRRAQVSMTRDAGRDALTISARCYVAAPPQLAPDADTWSRTALPAPLENVAAIALTAATVDRLTRPHALEEA